MKRLWRVIYYKYWAWKQIRRWKRLQRKWCKTFGLVKVNVTDADGKEHTEYMKYDRKKWAEWRWVSARPVDRGDK